MWKSTLCRWSSCSWIHSAVRPIYFSNALIKSCLNINFSSNGTSLSPRPRRQVHKLVSMDIFSKYFFFQSEELILSRHGLASAERYLFRDLREAREIPDDCSLIIELNDCNNLFADDDEETTEVLSRNSFKGDIVQHLLCKS